MELRIIDKAQLLKVTVSTSAIPIEGKVEDTYI